MPRATPKVEVLKLSDLTPDPENARAHNERNIGMIGDSLQEVGAWRSIGIDENNTVMMGNGVVEAAAERGFDRVVVVEADGQTIVAVKRTGMTDEQKRRAALFDNRTGELSEWNLDRLKEWRDEDPTAFRGMFTDKELSRLVGAAAVDASATVEGWESQHLIVIECPNEDEQRRLLEQFMGEGLKCRALAS